MIKKLYIGNLSYNTTESDVREMMAEFGTIESVAMINDRDTGRFRGFCFVELENEAAQEAIRVLNNKEVGGRNLMVNEAKPRNDRNSGGGGGGNRRRY